MSTLSLIGWLITAGGTWLASRALRNRLRRLRLIRDHVRVEARVIRLEDTTTEGDTAATHAPVVSFYDGGKLYEKKFLPELVERGCKVGQVMSFFYERGHPENAVRKLGTKDVNIALVLSILVVLFGAGLILTARQEAQAGGGLP